MVQRKSKARAVSDKPGEPVRIDERIPTAAPPGIEEAPGVPSPAHLTVQRELGRGGMGRVHVATDRNLLRRVALKYLASEYLDNAFYRDGFIAEAQITGQLEHPNIVPLHELSVDQHGVPYFTMKYVRGESFQAWLWNPERPPGTTERLEQGLEIFLRVCDAVAYAHHRGVLHRDLKPDNIMVGAFGQAYLMDWGLSRIKGSKTSGAGIRQMDAPGPTGTPHYMSPEQALGEVEGVDERSDIFGLGGLLYEIIAGIPPYGDVPGDVALERAKRGAVIPMREACAGIGVSGRIRAIAERATHPDREQRYQTVLALQADVRRFLQGGLHLPRKAYAPGTAIVKEGDPGDAAYLIVSGTCRAYRTADDGKVQELSKIEAGEVFGEMALLTGDSRVATVEAVDRVTVLVLDKDTITEGLGTEGWTGALVRALASRYRSLLVGE